MSKVDFYSVEKIKKARKEHECECCSSKILVGEPYERHAGCWEDNFFSFKICPVCSKILQYYLDNVDTEFVLDEIIGELMWEKDVQELLKEIKHPSERVKDYIEEYEEEQRSLEE